MKKFVRQAKLPRGAFTKSLEEVIEPYRKRAYAERRFMSKIILEVYPDKKISYEMNDEVFQLISNVLDQSKRIHARTSLAYIYARLPEEIKHKIKVTKYGGMMAEINFPNGAVAEKIIIDETYDK